MIILRAMFLVGHVKWRVHVKVVKHIYFSMRFPVVAYYVDGLHAQTNSNFFFLRIWKDKISIFFSTLSCCFALSTFGLWWWRSKTNYFFLVAWSQQSWNALYFMVWFGWIWCWRIEIEILSRSHILKPKDRAIWTI